MLTPADRELLRAAIDAKKREVLADERIEDRVVIAERCLGMATEGSYVRGCSCPDCREAGTVARRRRRQLQASGPRLTPRVRAVASRYRIEGGDRQDADQVALLAVYEAWSNFEPGRGVPFEAFAVEVAKRRLWDAQHASRRRKHRVLTEADGLEVLELLPRLAPDPLDVVIARDNLRAVLAVLPSLTAHERDGLRIVLNGIEYGGDRSVSNSITRMRKKMRAALAA